MTIWVDILSAEQHSYDNTSSGLTATQVQAAINELAAIAGASGFTSVDVVDNQASVTAIVGTLYIVTTGVTNPICTVSLPSPTSEGGRIGVLFLVNNLVSDTIALHPAVGDLINSVAADVVLPGVNTFVSLISGGDGTNWYVSERYGMETKVYVQASEPSGASIGTIWIQTLS